MAEFVQICAIRARMSHVRNVLLSVLLNLYLHLHLHLNPFLNLNLYMHPNRNLILQLKCPTLQLEKLNYQCLLIVSTLAPTSAF